MAKKNSRVTEICAIPKNRKCWVDRLKGQDRLDAEETRAICIRDGLPKATVARNLIRILGLNISAQTVTAWFDEVPNE